MNEGSEDVDLLTDNAALREGDCARTEQYVKLIPESELQFPEDLELPDNSEIAG